MIGLLQKAPDEIQPFPAFPLPLACIRGMKEVVKPVVSTEVRRTIRGESVALPAPWSPKAGFRLTNAGPGVLVPPDDYLPIGQQLAFASSRPQMRVIQGGASLISLARRIVPGSVHATDAVGNPIPAHIGPITGGREPFSIVVPSAPAFAFVHFRLIYDCLIVGLSEVSSDFTGRDVGWTIELEEQYAR